MGSILLDTTVLIDALRGRPVVDRLRSLRKVGDVPSICAINVEEVVRGLRSGEEEPFRRLTRGCRLVALGEEEGRRAGEWRRAFALAGVTLTQADCLIAAAALRIGGRVATGNPSDFPMPELAVEHWPVGA